MMHLIVRCARALGFILALAAIGGCGKGQGGYERYVPSAPAAQDALEAVLRDWQAGGGGANQLASPSLAAKVHVVDAQREPGQKLKRYRLLGEISGDGPRSFEVELELEPGGAQRVRYYLVGVDPLWVFRQEDYDHVAHWGACLEEEPAAAP